MIVSKSKRLRLCQVQQHDWAFIQALYNDPDCIRFIGDRGISNQEKAQAYIGNMQSSYQEHGFGLYRVELASTAIPIGICGLVKRDYLQVPDIGFAFLPDYRRDGYALEAGLATLQFANDIGICELLAIVKDNNTRSIALLEKLGMQHKCPMTLPDGDPVLLYQLTP